MWVAKKRVCLAQERKMLILCCLFGSAWQQHWSPDFAGWLKSVWIFLKPGFLLEGSQHTPYASQGAFDSANRMHFNWIVISPLPSPSIDYLAQNANETTRWHYQFIVFNIRWNSAGDRLGLKVFWKYLFSYLGYGGSYTFQDNHTCPQTVTGF